MGANNGNKKTRNAIAIASIIILVIVVLFYFVRRKPTLDILRSDFIVFLPYLIVGGISFVFAFLDIYEKFPDFGVGLPLKTKYGWIHLLFNTVTPMVLLYGYLTYFVPVLGTPEIGDVWMTAFVVALAFPLLIRSKFFSYTNSSGDTVSVGFDQLYDRLVEFFVREILRSSRALEKRRNLINVCSDVLKLCELKKEALLSILNHTDWKEERKIGERKKITEIMTNDDLDKIEKEHHLGNYILLSNGEDYLTEISIIKVPNDQVKKQRIEKSLEEYKFSLGRNLPSIFQREVKKS